MMLYRFVLVCIFLPVLLFCSGCASAGKAQKDNASGADNKAELLIYIQQSPCMGKCPVYEASFYTGRKMVYNGLAHMPVTGKYEYLLPADLTKNLIFEAVKMNLKLVPDSVTVPPDAPVVHLWVTINGKMKKMVGFTAGGNQTFTNYVKLIHSEVRAMISEQQGLKIP